MKLEHFKEFLQRRVVRLRKVRHMTQAELAACGISWKTIQAIEYGWNDARASTLLRLAEAFGMPLDEFLAIGESPDGDPFPAKPAWKPAQKPPSRRRREKARRAAPAHK